MSSDSLSRQILDGTQRAGKFYSFDEEHDETVPADLWFQESDEGLILFVVFFCQACRWSRCLGCNLPSRMSARPVSYKALLAQVDWVFRHPEVIRRRISIRKVIVANNGSVLDQETFSSTALMYLLVQLNLHLPHLDLVSMETRAEYVEVAELEFVARALREGDTPTQLELAVGVEAMDDRIRNRVFDKGLSRQAFESLARRLAPYGYRMKCYFMQKPVPGMTDAEAIEDIRDAIEYLGQIATRYRIPINMHLNPTFVAAGTPLEDAFRKGQYGPPLLSDVARAAYHARDKPISVFLGLYDEGLAMDGGSFLRDGDQPLVELLERFNRCQDYDLLAEVANRQPGDSAAPPDSS
jgi:radical SAM enzyme (TIGR01210 family)